MTTYKSLKVPFRVSLIKETIITVSGTVTDGASPLKREIVGFRYPDFEVPFKTISDSSDGSFSLDIIRGPQNRYVIMILGVDSTENSVVFDWIED